MPDHLWIRADRLHDRVQARAELDLPPVLAVVNAHRRLRGPYTAAGALIRAVAADAFARCPELAARHNVELASVAPELMATVPAAWQTLEWTVRDGERTRFYSGRHTLNIANGLADFLRSYLGAHDDGPRALVVENVHEADPTDREFLAVLLRRNDIPQLKLVLGTGCAPLEDQPGEVPVSLSAVLAARAAPVDVPASVRPVVGGDARAFVDSDGTGDDPADLAAYNLLAQHEREALHDVRYAELHAMGEQSLALGAIVHHAERGSRPAVAGVRAIEHAMGHCRKVGLHHAAADLGARGRALVDQRDRPGTWWYFTEGLAASLAAVGRFDEAAAVHQDARATSVDPEVHLMCAYGSAMLHVDHLPPRRRDLGAARAWLNLAAALASLLPDLRARLFHSAFGRNGLALLALHEGDPEEAVRLLDDCVAVLDGELEDRPLHRSSLRHNRARALAAAGRFEDALADHVAVAALDPGFAEHHFHVGTALRALGRDEEALAAFERVLPLSPPFPEVHHDIGDTRMRLGDPVRALAAFERVLVLDPDHVGALANRAGLRCALGDTTRAWADVAAGLALAPDDARLLCVKGRLLAERGEAAEAERVLTAALAVDPDMVEAWALRGQVRFDAADVEGALEDLDRAVALGDRPELHYNRAVAYEEAGRYGEAAADYRLVLAAADDENARARLDFCLRSTR
ncbi:tetratricopeptide repeat protein [Umezawaea sp. Da 62-37]|uniref:tetratricopeptide repeat protein n=1 Tax=Umezawaea sp. Da 62-37 TaxID=3075927 RepID=UPI0028F6EB10|nr:tetratricopeptide repeat protein [Umezawaea sp. Da 62-37]WNV88340.1 tetratricopeptide repeat protein [Umezawaea sp. Da 62-37]